VIRLIQAAIIACLDINSFDKEAERSTKTTVQLSNIDAGAGGISLTANDKHSNDKHADNNPANQSDSNPFVCL
jgi:hypothetical protein